MIVYCIGQWRHLRDVCIGGGRKQPSERSIHPQMFPMLVQPKKKAKKRWKKLKAVKTVVKATHAIEGGRYKQFKEACSKPKFTTLPEKPKYIAGLGLEESLKQVQANDPKRKKKKQKSKTLQPGLSDVKIEQAMIKQGHMSTPIKELFYKKLESEYNKTLVSRNGVDTKTEGKRYGFVTSRGDFEENGQHSKKKHNRNAKGLPYLVRPKVGEDDPRKASMQEHEYKTRNMNKDEKKRYFKQVKHEKRDAMLLVKEQERVRQAYVEMRESLREMKKAKHARKADILRINEERRLESEQAAKLKMMKQARSPVHGGRHNHAGGGSDLIRQSWAKNHPDQPI